MIATVILLVVLTPILVAGGVAVRVRCRLEREADARASAEIAALLARGPETRSGRAAAGGSYDWTVLARGGDGAPAQADGVQEAKPSGWLRRALGRVLGGLKRLV